jgi:hypothetical protein
MVPLRFGSRARREVTIFELGVPPGSFAEHHAEQIGLKGKVVSEKVQAKRAAKVVRNRDRRERRKGSE